jgi:uracil-DNA glycosylase
MKKPNNWDLSFWTTGEWQVIQERLDDYDAKQTDSYVPARSRLFDSLRLSPMERTRACIIGQDPYPGRDTQGRSHATGLAFSVSETVGQGNLPPTLKNIFREYVSDLKYPTPKNGDLTPWANQGVLLWNVYPMLMTGPKRSCHWPEWLLLTEEIVRKLDEQDKTVFILLGTFARSCSRWVSRSPCIKTSHPSPMGANKGFLGSKIFSRTNNHLELLGLEPIDWRLPDAEKET